MRTNNIAKSQYRRVLDSLKSGLDSVERVSRDAGVNKTGVKYLILNNNDLMRLYFGNGGKI